MKTRINIELFSRSVDKRFQGLGLTCGLILALGSILPAQTPDAEPDILEFNNGEKLIGHLVSASGGNVTFHSDSAGDITADWAKIKTLHASGKFAVPEKGVVLGRHAEIGEVPQGKISLGDQHLTIDPATGTAPTVIAVANIANVVPQQDFLKAFETPKLWQDWHGLAGLGIDLISATQQSRNITAAVSAQRVVSGASWISPRYKTTFNFNLADGKLSQTGTPTINTDLIHANLEHDVYLSNRSFAFGSADFMHSLSQGMKLQQTYSLGFGYVLLKDDRQELDVKASVAYIQQDFNQSEGNAVQPDKSLVGGTFSETYNRNLPYGVVFREGLNYIPAFNDTSAYTYNAFANFSIPVHKRLSITIGGNEAYINEPPAGFRKNSFEFVTQLSYKIN